MRTLPSGSRSVCPKSPSARLSTALRPRMVRPQQSKERKNRDLALREAEMWHGCKKKLGLAQEEEKAIFHAELGEHKREEGT